MNLVNRLGVHRDAENKVPFELELLVKRRGCCEQSHSLSIHLCVWLVWALTLFQGSPTSVRGLTSFTTLMIMLFN